MKKPRPMPVTSPMGRLLVRSALVAALVLPLATACGTMTDIGATRVACQASEPILWSKEDTDETIRQVKEHNARWTSICSKE